MRLFWRTLGLRAGTQWYLASAMNLRGKVERVSIRPAMLDHPVHLRMGESSDSDVFNQVFVDGQYGLATEFTEAKAIMDLGANIGLVSALFLSLCPKARVIAVEPEPGNFEATKLNLAPYGDRAKCLWGAVWPTRGSVSLDRSIGDQKEWSVRTREGAGVRAYDMPELLEISGPLDLLKIDIEEAEGPLFSGDTSWLKSVKNICIELHGPECEAAFRRGMRGWKWEESVSKELTVCKNMVTATA